MTQLMDMSYLRAHIYLLILKLAKNIATSVSRLRCEYVKISVMDCHRALLASRGELENSIFYFCCIIITDVDDPESPSILIDIFPSYATRVFPR